MRIKLIIKDVDYRIAFMEGIAASDRDIYVEVLRTGKIKEIDNNSIIVTDVNPSKVDKRLYKCTIFLTDNNRDVCNAKDMSCYKIFKYRNINHVLSDIEEIYYLFTGDKRHIFTNGAKIVAVCSDNSIRNSEICKALARQISFRQSGDILVLPLRYINDYARVDERDNSIFSRLIYNSSSSKQILIDSYVYKDSYGISYLRLMHGINPLCNFSSEELINFVNYISGQGYSIIILDIADCYNEQNIEILNSSNNILYINKNSKFRITDIISDKEIWNRINQINILNNNQDIELLIDDYTKKILKFGDKLNEKNKEGINSEI